MSLTRPSSDPITPPRPGPAEAPSRDVASSGASDTVQAATHSPPVTQQVERKAEQTPADTRAPIYQHAAS